jgi:DNA-binding MarR family transcriptional regulator
MPKIDYAALLAFRTALRRFNAFSEEQAAAVGLTHSQHQLLLVVKAYPSREGPTVGDIADSLLIKHHSAVELLSRTEALGLVTRNRDPDDGRVVRVTLTRDGEAKLVSLTELHLDELETLGTTLRPLIDRGNAEE